MQRRSFIRRAAVGGGLGGAVLAAPAIVGANPQVRWRLTSSFPKSLDTIYGAAEYFAKRVSDSTGGRFQISVHPAGEIVPGLQALDAVQNGTVEANHTAPYYYFGKDPAWAFGTAIPFGLNKRQGEAWWHHGGFDKQFNDWTRASYNVVGLLAGNTGAQMGGWFRKELNTLDDMKGLKFRIGGFGGQIISKVGVVPQQIAGGDIYASLEKGTIDGAEWVGPYDDEKLGFNKVARYYYYPGWWEGGAALHVQVNAKAWDALPAEYRAIVSAAAAEANTWMMSKYDAQNPAALKRLIASGAVLRAYPRPILEACYRAAQETYAEISGRNAGFKRFFDSMLAFQRDQVSWFRVTENTFDDFMATMKRNA